jgi:hypothetical protein
VPLLLEEHDNSSKEVFGQVDALRHPPGRRKTIILSPPPPPRSPTGSVAVGTTSLLPIDLSCEIVVEIFLFLHAKEQQRRKNDTQVIKTMRWSRVV